MENRSNPVQGPPESGDRNIVFIGLGTMGLPMATNLVKAGFTVTGHDRNAVAVDALVAAGGRASRGDADVGDAQVIVTMLPDDAIVDAVLGGDAAHVERARPILAPMGNELHVCGAVGTASAMKLINNALVACINAASIEALVAGCKANLGLDLMMGVFKSTMAWNQALAVGLPRKALRRDFKPGFMTKLAHKDVGLALSMARTLDVPMTQGAAAYAILEQALRDGYGADDNPGSMLRVCESKGGVELSL